MISILTAEQAETIAARAAELGAQRAIAAATSASTGPRVDMDDLARSEGCSRATIRRLAAEPGAPVHYLGASMRFDVVEWRAWCDTRGPLGTKPSKTASTGGVVRRTRGGR